MFKSWIGVLILGGIVGALATVGADEANRVTSTDAFCTSCHSMQAYIAEDPVYQKSPHQTGKGGVRAGCADCHIAPGNILSETWAHASAGVRDIVAEMTAGYDDPAVWTERRPHLAYEVRDWMMANDSATCRSCHDAAQIAPTTPEGRTAHTEMVTSGEKTCIQCHLNLVHAPVEPRLEFIRARAPQGR